MQAVGAATARAAAVLTGRWLAAVAIAALACVAVRADQAPDPVVAQWGTVTITAGEVRRMLAAAEPELRQQMERDPVLLRQRVRERLVQLVLFDKAHAEKWDERPEVAYRAELAKEASIADSYLAAQISLAPDYPSEKEVAAAYEVNKTKLIRPRQYHLAQILVAVPQGASAATEAAAQSRAAELRRQVADGRKDFAALARQASDDRSRENGGDLGWVQEDTLAPEVRQALSALPQDAVTEPVRLNDGWHVLKVLGIKPSGQATLAEAHDTLVHLLRRTRILQLRSRYLADLLQKEPIRIDEIELRKQAGP